MENEMSTKQIVGILDALNADPDLERGCRHVCGLAANIVLVCDQRGEELIKAADTIERLQKDTDAGRELMRQAWHVFNGIRAADGAPYGYTHEWWDGITEAFNDLLGDDTVPWMTGAAHALINPLIKEIQDEQDARSKAEQERDAALAEVERVKGQLQAAETSIQAHRGFVRS